MFTFKIIAGFRRKDKRHSKDSTVDEMNEKSESWKDMLQNVCRNSLRGNRKKINSCSEKPKLSSFIYNYQRRRDAVVATNANLVHMEMLKLNPISINNQGTLMQIRKSPFMIVFA